MYQKCIRFRSILVEVVEVRNRYAPDLNIENDEIEQSIYLHFQQTQQQNNLFH